MATWALLLPRIRNTSHCKYLNQITTQLGGSPADTITFQNKGIIFPKSQAQISLNTEQGIVEIEDISMPKVKYFVIGHLSYPSYNIANRILVKPMNNGGRPLKPKEKFILENGDWIGFSCYIYGNVDQEWTDFVGQEQIFWFMYININKIYSQKIHNSWISFANGEYTLRGKAIFSPKLIEFHPWISAVILCNDQRFEFDTYIYQKCISIYCDNLPLELIQLLYNFCGADICEMISWFIGCHLPILNIVHQS